MSAVRTGASVSTRNDTTSAGETSTIAPDLVCNRTVGSKANRRPIASVNGGTDPGDRR